MVFVSCTQVLVSCTPRVFAQLYVGIMPLVCNVLHYLMLLRVYGVGTLALLVLQHSAQHLKRSGQMASLDKGVGRRRRRRGGEV